MLTTMALPTIMGAATTEPSATYNAVQRQIAATVIVYLPPNEAEPIFEAPLIAIPGPGMGSDIWTVIWTLVAGAGIISATFAQEKGIDLTSSLPPKLHVKDSSPVPDQPSQWQVTFQNNVLGANSFTYLVNAELVRATDRQLLPFRHDPTIVVTQDPIG